MEVPIEADEGVLTDAPLVFCYGHTEVMHNSDVYLAQVDRCAIPNSERCSSELRGWYCYVCLAFLLGCQSLIVHATMRIRPGRNYVHRTILRQVMCRVAAITACMVPERHAAYRLAQLCKARETEYEGRYQNLASGTIIDTPGCQSGQERDAVKHICQAFAADIILVIGEDKLHSLLDSAFQVLR